MAKKAQIAITPSTAPDGIETEPHPFQFGHHAFLQPHRMELKHIGTKTFSDWLNSLQPHRMELKLVLNNGGDPAPTLQPHRMELKPMMPVVSCQVRTTFNRTGWN